MIEDPIPAAPNFIERDGVYNLRNPPVWWATASRGAELHDDRMAILPDVLQRPAAVFLLVESREPRRVPGESGSRDSANVSDGR
jgi:hypothetical protein